MSVQKSYGHVLGGTLLVAGTSIGAGMLGLPILTGLGGFMPAAIVHVVCWLFMTCTGLLLLELCLKLPPDVNLVSIATFYFGRLGKAAAWVLYLFLFYCLSIAYVSGGGAMLQGWLGIASPWAGGLLFLACLAPFVYFGAKVVDRINLFLMVGLIGTYLLFVILGLPHVNLTLLSGSHWKAAVVALPIVFTSFSYQGIIPSLVSYMRRDVQSLRLAIVLGTSLTFIIYLFWEFLILGIIPIEGPFGLEEASRQGQTVIEPLKHQMISESVAAVGQAFGFFAIATSYLGVTLGLLDFLADGFRMAKKGLRRLWLAFLTFVPPLGIALTKPGIFLTALTYAGGIGCALLLGLLPTLMVWVSRRQGQEGPIVLRGGRPLLALLAVFVIVEVMMELLRV